MNRKRARFVLIIGALICLPLGALAMLLLSDDLAQRFAQEVLLRQQSREGCLAHADLTGECLAVPDEAADVQPWISFNNVTAGRPALAAALDAAALKALSISVLACLALPIAALAAAYAWINRKRD
ncbi:hypothetical protein [Dongia sp.]|uniref:hypothetical protein n=1 Tax=Dongia sp. TaxID=1977262 RepID=UPI0037516C22